MVEKQQESCGTRQVMPWNHGYSHYSHERPALSHGLVYTRPA